MGQRTDLSPNHPCLGCRVSAEALCNVLSVGPLAELRNNGRSISLAPGQSLFHQGDKADWVFSLTSGVIKLYSVLPDGRRQIVAFHFPGEFIGFCNHGAYHCTAEAVSPAILCKFAAARFELIEQTSLELGRSRRDRVTRDLAATQDRVLLLGRATARERLASFLYDVFRRCPSVSRGGANLVSLPMDRCDIADYLGLAKETVSRELSALRGAGIIRRRTRRLLEILDLEGIARLALTG